MLNRRNISIFAALLCGLVIALFGQSARLLQQLEAQGISIQYAQGSPLSGRAFIHAENQWQPLWLNLNWRWCPRLNPASWCIQAASDVGEANGRLALGLNTLSLNNTQLSGSNIKLLLAGFVDTHSNIEANIDTLVLQQRQNLDAIKAVDATVLVSEISALGFDFTAHRIHALRQAEQNFSFSIKGDEANGTASLTRTGTYQTKLLLTPSEQLSHLLKSQLPEVSSGTFKFEQSGKLQEMQ